MNYLDHHDWVVGCAERLAKKHNLDRDEAVQDAYFGFIKAVEKFDDSQGAAFKTFATIKIRGAILDENRKRSWFGRYHFDATPGELPDEIGTSEISIDEFEKIIKPIGRSEKLRVPIWLHLVVGMTIPEIAKFCGLKISTVSGNYHYGINRLRAYYA